MKEENFIFDDIVCYEQKCLCVFIIDTFRLKNDMVINEVALGIHRILEGFESDEASRERVEVSFITYDSLSDEISVVQEPVPISQAAIPSLTVNTDDTSLTRALYMAMDVVDKQVTWYKNVGIPYYRPWIFLISSGMSLLSCKIDEIVNRIKQDTSNKKYVFLPICTKDAEAPLLQEIESDVPITTLDSLNITDCFKWLSSSVGEVCSSNSVSLTDNCDWMEAFTIGESCGSSEICSESSGGVGSCDIDNDSDDWDVDFGSSHSCSGETSSESSGGVDDAWGNFVFGDSCGGETNSESSGYDGRDPFDDDDYINDFWGVSHGNGASGSQHDEQDWQGWPGNNMTLESFGSKPLGHSIEEKAQQLAEDKIVLSQLKQLRHEEERCRRHIDVIRYGLKEQKQIETYCMIRRDELPYTEICSYALRKFDSVDKMQELLNNRLAQLQNTTSFFYRLRGENEIQMIKELLNLLESLEMEQKEMLRKIEALFQSEMHEVEHRLSYSGIRANKESLCFLESCLSEYERELQDLLDRRRGLEKEFDRKRKEREMDEVYSSIFAPSEVKRKSHMLVQIYLHLYEETEKVKSLAQESDKDAERRDYIPLLCKLKKGDKVDVLLNIYGEALLMSDKKSVVWQGSFTKCSFDYFVPKDIDVEELSCLAMLTVNGVPVGEMRFITKIVESPRQLNTEMIAHKYNKVFISYAHKDEAKVKSFHEGLKLAGIEHFFDRNYLKAGDIFPQVIQDYINTADLFVLFWSENASKSEYVQKERNQALERAFPQVKPQQAAKLSIYPMSIEPRAELPSDMKENYHFGEI